MKMQRQSVITGKWAKVLEDINEGDIITILNEGIWDESGSYNPTWVFQIRTASGEEKNLSINKTSINNLINAYGEESSEWIGKQAKAHVIKQRVGDSMKNVIYLVGRGWMMNEEGRFVKNPNSPAAQAETTKTPDEEIPTVDNEEEPDFKIEDIPF